MTATPTVAAFPASVCFNRAPKSSDCAFPKKASKLKQTNKKIHFDSLLITSVINYSYKKTSSKQKLFTRSLFVRLKGLEPPRREASDPKSDVATNYTTAA